MDRQLVRLFRIHPEDEASDKLFVERIGHRLSTVSENIRATSRIFLEILKSK